MRKKIIKNNYIIVRKIQKQKKHFQKSIFGKRLELLTKKLNKLVRVKYVRRVGKLIKFGVIYAAIIYFSLGNLTPFYSRVLAQMIDTATQSALFAPSAPLPIPQLSKPFSGDYPVSRIYGDTTLDHQDSDFGRALSKAEGPKGNNGLDFAMPEGTPLLAVDDGQVVQAEKGDYGLDVIIQHSWGKSIYGHLSELGSFNPTPGFLQSGDQRKLQPGDMVKKGDVIGWAGHTGLATGPHVHFGLKDSIDAWVDPAVYLGLPQYAAQNQDQTATASAIFAGLQSQVLGIATDSATVSIPVMPDTSPATDAYHYKFGLAKGNSVHFWDKQNKRADFAISDNSKNNQLGFTLQQNSASNSATPKLNGNQVSYPITVGSAAASLEYTVTDSKVKENIILQKQPDLSSGDLPVAFDVNQTGLTVKSLNGAYEFTSLDGADDWIVQAPTVVDSNGKAGDVTATLQNSVYTLHVSKSFLEQAAYPVTIDPTVVINTSSDLNATQVSTMHHIVRTSDGTLHAFVQIGTQTATCGGSSKSGLLWFNSTDGGSTWTCQAQLSSDTTHLFYADAEVDSSDNIYVVYSQVATGAGATLDTNYRKLTYTGSHSWTLGTERLVLDGTGSVGYSYANIEIQSTTRLWIAARYYDGANYQVSVYDSGDQTDNPTWTLSQTALDTAGSTNTKHIPTMVRFGSSIGVIWSDQTGTGLFWRTRGDNDTLTSWVSQVAVLGTAMTTSTFAAAADASGHVYVTANISTNVDLVYFNGSTWTATLAVSATAASAAFVSLATDNDNVWIFYGDTTNLAAGLSGSRKLVYKQCHAPFLVAGDCDSTSTNVNSYQDIFDKVWAYRNTGAVYTDVTTAAGNTTTADVINSSSSKMVSALSDVIYFGKTAQFDSVSWALSTAGVGGTIVWEYCSAVDGSSNCTTWSTLTLTASSTPSFTATTNGYGSFTPPGGWVQAKVNSESTAYYYVRARVSVAFTTAPIGTQVAAIPQVNWVSAVPNVVSNTIYLTWNENATSPEKVRYGSATVTGLTPGSDSPLNSVVGYSSANTATQLSTQHHMIKTSDGTLHAFVQGGTLNVCGAGSGTAVGLVWVDSTDGGNTWTCQGQLNSSSTIYADARIDSSDNIYVVYSMAANGASANNNVYYRKLTYNGSFSWTLGSEQTVFSGSASIGYAYATLEVQGTSRIWVAARYFDGTNYQVSVDYSSDQSNAPTWTQSITNLDTVGSTNTKHIPTMVRFGSNIGVIWSDQTASGLYWRIRSDSDGLTSWTSQEAVFTTAALTTATYTAVSDSSGHIYVATNASTSVYLNYFNGSTWTASLVVSATAASAAFVSLSTDGNNVWVFYGDTTNLSASLTGTRKLVYKKCLAPFLNTTDCDTNSTNVTSSQDVYDKVWQYASSTYADKTSAAGNSTAADVAMVSTVGDIMYFGKTAPFSTVAWVLSTSGTVGVVRWEYYNGSSWVAIPTFITQSNQNFLGSGYIEFIPMSDWATTSINGEGGSYYYIRARVITNYTIAPVGTQMAALPQINWANALSNVTSNTTPLLWTENANSPWRIRYATITTTSSSRTSAAAIAPTVGFSAVTTASQISSMHHIVRTSDGTLHAFMQSSTTLACGGQGGSNSIGLVWMDSTDSGSTWTCQGQLNAAATYFADARVDSSDNIYVVYSMVANGAGAANDVMYRKLTYTGSSTWTLGSEQVVLNGSGSIGYAYATLELDPTHVWVAARYYDGANYQVNVWYSSNQTDNPSWTQSMLALDTAGSTATRHTPTMVRFGTNIGVIWNDQTATGLVWRFRNDSDGLTSWVGQVAVFATAAVAAGLFDAVSDSSGHVYVAVTATTTVYMTYFNTVAWTAPLTVSSTASSALFVSLSTDGNNVWVFYGDTTGLNASLGGGRKLVYKKCAPPFLNATDCDSTGTNVTSYQDVYDKVWQYVASGPTYTDKTSAAGNSTTADVSMVSAVGDIMYFGKTAQFGTVAWSLSTNGTSGVVEWEYYNGSTWKPLTDILVSSTPNFTAASGYITFLPNSDWTATSINGEGSSYYYIRARVITAYGTAPVGTQMAALPQINWASALSNVTSSTIPLIWTEDAATPERVRYAGVSISSTTRVDAVSIGPSILAYSARPTATQASGERRLVRTSDGTLHAFIQAASTQSACGSAAGTNTGLVWVMSTDGGDTWTCQGQLNVSSSYTADTEIDSSDNIYVVYSQAGSTTGATMDVFYRKFTYNGSHSWTMGAEQVAIDNTVAGDDYSYATIESEGTTRLWIAARFFDGTNYQVTAYDSNDMSNTPTWTQSIATLDTAGANASYHIPQIVRTDAKIAIIYNDQGTSGDMFWSYRSDGDTLTSWHAVATATSTTAVATATFSAVGDTNGNIYLAINDTTHVYFTYYNGSSWSTAATVSSTASSGNFVALSTDGTSVWVVYGDTTSLAAGLSGNHAVVYKKGVSPFASGNFDTNPTTIVTSETTFTKAWAYRASDTSYTDVTTAASNTTTADIKNANSGKLVNAVGDIIYFGSSAQFDSLSWVLSTNGTTGVVEWEYWNGSAWTPLTDILVSATPNFTGSGYISFTPNSDWVKTSVNGEGTSYYYVRARVTTAFGTAPIGTQSVAIPQINWANLADSTHGVYAMWEENAAAPERIRFQTILENLVTSPTLDQILRHGEWFLNGVRQPFTF